MFFILALPLRRFLGKPSEVSNNNPNHGLQIHGTGLLPLSETVPPKKDKLI